MTLRRHLAWYCGEAALGSLLPCSSMLLFIDGTAAALLQDGDEVTQDLPLHVASASGHMEVVRLLLASGRCQVDPATKVGRALAAAGGCY